MRSTKVVSISLPAEMLTEAEALAQQENRTMSELVREALRSYKREREGWRNLLDYGKTKGRGAGIKNEEDVVRAVREVRQKSKRRSKTGTK
jgi:CopG family transcriptional regulator/antitoxin EndoAI